MVSGAATGMRLQDCQIVIVTLTRSIAGYRSEDCINSGATDTKTGTRAVTVIIKLRAKPLLGTGDNQGKSVGPGH